MLNPCKTTTTHSGCAEVCSQCGSKTRVKKPRDKLQNKISCAEYYIRHKEKIKSVKDRYYAVRTEFKRMAIAFSAIE
jgi:bisphosphoglycerate-independent phosphoglycerate mutase (AlkP superfamily)